MFCSLPAKIVGGIGGACSCIAVLMVIVPWMMAANNAAAVADEHGDGAAVTFYGDGALSVTVQCSSSERLLPWGIWIAASEDCAVRNTAFSVVGPQPTTAITVDDMCGSDPYPSMAAGAANHDPVLVKAASFSPIFQRDTLGNQTAVLGSYTVNCGATPCWVVDNSAVVLAELSAATGAVAGAVGALLATMFAMALGSIASLLICISCCIACASEEPDERSTKLRQDDRDEEEGDE